MPATENPPDLELQLSHRFRDWIERVSWLKPSEDLYATTVDPDMGFDIAAQVDTPAGEQVIFLVLAKESVRPSDVGTLVSRIRQRLAAPDFHQRLSLAGPFKSDARLYPILAARWLSPRTVQRIAAEHGVGWFDLVGNVHFDFPGGYLHAEGIPNPFASKERTIAWTSDHAQRVLRVLLEPKHLGQSWKQRDLSMACFPKVSLGTVNKVVRRLLASAYAEETDQGLRLTDPEGLLRDWAANYRPIHQATRTFYTTLHGDALQERLVKLFSDYRISPLDPTATFALAGSSAAVWFAPLVRAPSLCLHATPGGERVLIKELELQPAEKGANVTLWITPRSDFYRDRQELPNGITTTSLVQTYLDLQAGGERGREAAEHLLTQKLKLLWNEWKSVNP
ncbi:MAG: type IV toxin-antitoxin system AbiEi family antitoxin [Verrucomicrobiota bacterium]